MNSDELLKEQENLMIRFLKLTEEAFAKLEKEDEEALPQIMEKRQTLIGKMQDLEDQLQGENLGSKEQQLRLQELKARILTENKHLQEKMTIKYKELQENIGKNKKARKVNKAYQGQQNSYSLYLNKKN